MLIIQTEKTIKFESSFLQILFWKDENIVEAKWNAETKKMMDDDFKTSIQTLWRIIKAHEPIGLLADTRDFLYTIPNNVQEWYGKNIIEGMGKKTEKVAMLVGKGFIEQLSIELTIEEDHSTGFSTQYFSDVEEALNWIMEK